MVASGAGRVEPQPKTLGTPVKGKMKTPLGIMTVNVRVSVAVALHGSVPASDALMVTGNVPRAVGVPEISPGVQPSPLLWQTVKPPGRPIASKLVGVLLAVI